mgnify:CR=1 FL=1
MDAWAASGAMALTRTASGQWVGPPEGLVPKLERVADRLVGGARRLGGALVVDPLPLLGERAALSGLPTGGEVSCGGSCRLLPTLDGWMAISLARPEDREAVPAWLGLEGPVADPWVAVTMALADRCLDELTDQAALLGLPYGRLPAGRPTPTALDAPLPVASTRVPGPVPTTAPLADVVVVDLTSLWAGPLCGSLLAAAGATVIKVESTRRPDGARSGPPEFYDRLNAAKRSVQLDLTASEGVRELRSLLDRADVVLEGSRPRALAQLGIHAEVVVASGRPRLWVSINAHGRDEGRDRVGFGDDAAVEGGLVAWAEGRPHFVADAIADPTSGLVAAAAAVEALVDGGRWLLDVSLSGVAAHLAGPTLPLESWTGTPAPPTHPRTRVG